MRNTDGRHRAAETIVLGAAGLVVVILGSACSPAAAPSPSPASSSTTVMLDQHTHAITTGVNCTSSAAQTTATPTESGDLTTRINAHDDAASVSLALSDETPPSVDGFAISLKVGTTEYQLPYQATQSATQVQATKQGKSYTVTGSGQAVTPGQSGTRQVTFGIHVTCP
jgi:hypothetical protein